MSAPRNREDAAGQILSILVAWSSRENVAATIADLVWEWLAEARASAEPRLRPVSEKPMAGDIILVKHVYAGWRESPRKWSDKHKFCPQDIGWTLLERAKPKTLAEEARELGEPPEGRPEMDHFAYVRALEKYAGGAAALLRRVAEEKRDA